MKKHSFVFLACLLVLTACKSQQNLVPTVGTTITQSVTLKKDTFLLSAFDSLRQVLTIEGENIIVDFNGAVINGGYGKSFPDQFIGTGILIKGKNITLKNATLLGFKVAIFAEGVDSLRLLDCNLSYNWRPRLRSIREREDFSDWLSFHQNDKDEWLRYGAGIYLKNCPNVLVRGCTVTQGMNGLLLTGCNDGLFYNNNFHFNSGLGIGMYRSSRNRVMHNPLDFNVRGYSHGFYQRGQDSAGILVFEQCNENVFAYNSATHSGDGFFLWAGQTTMDTGEGGCNDNLIYSNDFSYAPTNGIEVTFSRNKIINNLIDDCTHGIWGGYSYESKIIGNWINNCRTGIAIEHGQDNHIIANMLTGDTVGIQLWARASQPSDWGYAIKRDTRSRDCQISHNIFAGVRNPLKISASKNITINDGNAFAGFEKLLVVEKPNEDFYFEKNQVAGDTGWHDAERFKPLNPTINEKLGKLSSFVSAEYKVEKMPDGMKTGLKHEGFKNRWSILMNEWGPYNHQYPAAFLLSANDSMMWVATYGPTGGVFKIINYKGFAYVKGREAKKLPNATDLLLEFEYTGPAFTDQFGNHHPADVPYRFTFRRFEKKLDWQVRWYNYDNTTDPLTTYTAFKNLKTAPPKATKTTDDLYFAWWGSPAEGVAEDKFATFAETEFDIEPGDYVIELTSDDGVKLFLDGKLLIDRWDIHEPAVDEVRVRLGGNHKLEVEHFDGGGFGTLDFRWRRVGE